MATSSDALNNSQKSIKSLGGADQKEGSNVQPRAMIKPGPNGGGLGKLAGLMKKNMGPAKNETTKGIPSSGASTAGSGGSLMGMLFLKKKLNKWKSSKLNTWNMNDSIRSSVKSAVENTYRLQPEYPEKFMPVHVRRCIEEVLERFLGKDAKFNPQTSSTLTRIISDEIKAKVKALDYNRYKLVVHVIMGQNLGQGLQAASRCVWDLEKDNSATLTFKTADIFVIVNVFGTYYE